MNSQPSPRRRERSFGKRFFRQGQQRLFGVITGNPVGTEKAAFGTTVDQYPFPAAAPDSRRFHDAAAAGAAVAYCQIDMPAVQTPGAMVALKSTGGLPGNGQAAMNTDEIFFKDKACCFACCS